MRNLRTAAAAGATAILVSLGGISVASAEPVESGSSGAAIFTGTQDGDKSTGEWISDGFNGLSSGLGSSQFFDDKGEPFFGTDGFGKIIDPENIPQWGRVWLDLTALAGIGSVIGGIIAGFNWASFNGLIHF